MENDDTANDHGDAVANALPARSTKQTRKERSKAIAASQESKKKKKHTFGRNWNEISRTRQLELFFLGIVAMGGVGYLLVTIWGILQTGQHFGQEHRPRIEFFREPALVGNFTCNIDGPHNIKWNFGPTYIWLKNVRNGDAVKVFVFGPQIKPVADPRSADESFNLFQSVTEDSCKIPPPPKMTLFSLNAGQEKMIESSDGTAGMTVNPDTVITPDTTFQLAGPLCVYYSDEEGNQHGTCATYRLIHNGIVRFSCKDSPINGDFKQMVTGSCEN